MLVKIKIKSNETYGIGIWSGFDLEGENLKSINFMWSSNIVTRNLEKFYNNSNQLIKEISADTYYLQRRERLRNMTCLVKSFLF